MPLSALGGLPVLAEPMRIIQPDFGQSRMGKPRYHVDMKLLTYVVHVHTEYFPAVFSFKATTMLFLANNNLILDSMMG